MGMLAQPQFAHVFTQPVAKLLFPLVIHTGDDAQAGGVSQVIKSFIESDAFVPRLLINCPLVIPIREIGRASCRERVCSVRVELGGSRISKKQKTTNTTRYKNTQQK